MADLFTLVGKIAIDSAESQETIDKITGSAENLGKKLNQASAGADNAGKKLNNNSKLGTGAVYLGNLLSSVTEAAVKFAMKLPGAAVKAAAGVEAERAAFESTFGEMADEASRIYKQIGTETNILETRLRTAGTKGYAQLKGSGLEANEALSASEKLLRLSADAAAYYDISLEDANYKLRSFMRGNTEAGDSIGLFTSESERNSAALDLYGQKWLGLTEAQRQFLMLDTAERIYKDTGVIGQAMREGEEWANVTANMTEAQTQSLATIGGPIKDSLLPALNDLSTWLANADTQAKLDEFAGTLGKISSMVFEGLTSAFDWLLSNGEAVGNALGVIALGLAAGAIAAHSYATAIMAVAAGLAWLTNEEGKRKMNQDHFFDGHDQEALEALQEWVEAKRALKEADDTYQMNVSAEEYDALVDAADAAAQKVKALDGELLGLYEAWRTNQENGLEYLDVPIVASEESESEMQATVEGYDLEGLATLFADPTSKAKLQSYLDSLNLSVDVLLNYVDPGVPHANGLDRVPFDGYRAVLHKDEAVLTASEAAVWRKGQSGYASISEESTAKASNDQPITVNLTVNGVSSSPYEIAGEVRNALELLRWQS